MLTFALSWSVCILLCYACEGGIVSHVTACFALHCVTSLALLVERGDVSHVTVCFDMVCVLIDLLCF